jgi:hypothetical protein
MVLKIDDDRRGDKMDRLLNLPSFTQYAKAKSGDDILSEDVLQAKEQKYIQIAKNGGISRTVVLLTREILRFTSVRKANRALNNQKVLEDMSQVSKFYGRDCTTTTLRHEMDASSLLVELFSLR